MCVFKCTKRWRERGGGEGCRKEGRKEGSELTVAAMFVLQGGERGDEGWELFFSPSVHVCVCV